ncbi:TonB-dependent receptor domain-containing protein [Sporomusa acidovorans]|uniref:Vitamin B12 transporter BtuB n=1 Tax=Sporomusa acidovorans (strain ATCC 49682 / DSM 3132 / Mol) TaxID=1123286 RepID=A0ABZ3J8Y9_SPOA4|nr:TonB-dependent receptor [Sporomusa acidovorans]OZC16140.1 pertactin autotransporter precursor [Sporomusa acidovorans DSM 3132]SDE28862.1 outer membrane autotransporter barrel domain-containing protein [Sporomusa acidovorans]
MRKLKKRDGRTKKRQALLAALAVSALLYTSPAYASAILNDATPDLKNMKNTSFTIGAGETVTTWSGTKERPSVLNVQYNGDIVVLGGGIWRPMDATSLKLVNGTFELYKDALVDMSYKYGENYPANTWNRNDTRSDRGFVAYHAILHDGAILRMNVNENDYSDSFMFNNPQLAAGEDSATVRVQIRYRKYFCGTDWEASQANYLSGSSSNIVSLTNLDSNVANNLNFAAESYYIDDSLHKYLFVPELTSVPSTDPYTGAVSKYYNIDWTATRTDLISQGVLSAANAQLSMRNLWRMEDGLFWKRGEDLRASNARGQSEGADGAWAQVWRGKYSFDGAYGSSFDQSYNGIQVGYDKQREGKIFGGKLYTGLFLSMLNSDADFHQHSMESGTDAALYSSSAGDLKSGGIGLYTSWLGDKGHYLDLTVRGSKLSNNYKFYDSDDELYENDYSTWAYGAGVRYGYQKQLPNGWYLEPQVGLTYGTMKAYSYTQANNMRYNQDKLEMLTGRMGVTAGRNFTNGDRKGRVYVKAAVNHDFKDGGSASADAMIYSSSYQKYVVGSSMAVDTLAGHDTWYEFALGTNLQTGKDKNAFVELTKTVGGKVNTDWQVNAGMSWRFNGPSSVERAAAQNVAFDRSMTAPEVSLAAKAAAKPQTTTAVGTKTAADKATQAAQPAQTNKTVQDGQTIQSGQEAAGTDKTVVGDKLTPPADQADQKTQASQEEQVKTGQAGQTEPAGLMDTDERPTTAAGTAGPETAPIVTGGNEPGSFTLAPLVVEAKRPDWEKNLSPGTVSVIHVPEYKGEMKNLPDLLQTVPGVYVQRLSGTGHYAVARVRGSSGGQVNIYIDGVLVNSSADAAVDLSTIPVENVERVEVYRGYVPARFAGSPLGGAINIVTKKPQESKGSISTGMRSFSGYTGNLELTAPLGEGSLLFALNRDQSQGDFRYDKHHPCGEVSDDVTESRWRMNNDYHNTDALLKWQDDHWFAKLTYKNNKTKLPESAYDYYVDMPLDEIKKHIGTSGNYDKYRKRCLETTKTELSLGRRQTAGNLEWGWKLDTSYQHKEAACAQFKPDSLAMLFATADNEFRNRRYEGAIDGSWKMGKNHLVEFLFDCSRETMKVDTNNFDVWPQNDSFTGVIDSYKQYFKTDYSTNNYFFQVQDTMTLNKSGNLFFTPVLRGQKMTMDVDLGDPDLREWKYSYGLGLKKVQNDHWTFRGTYGTYYKFPNFYELFGDGVNVRSRWEEYRSKKSDFMLDSYVEHGTSWDVSANWQGKALQADTDVTLTYFNRDVKNLSTYALDPYGYGYYSNLAAGKIQGVELESKMNWQRWNLLQSVTWNDSLITKSGMYNMVTKSESQAGKPFPWVPKWETNTRLSYRFPGDKLTVFGEYHYLGKTGVHFGETSALYDSLGLTNIGMKYDLNSTTKLTAGVNDLFNKGPEQLWRRTGAGPLDEIGNVSYPQQGRTYYMTVQYFF